MKSTFVSAAIVLASFFSGSSSDALAQCANTDFEDGNFTNWDGFTGNVWDISTPGIVPGRHTIITQSTPDQSTGGNIMTMPPYGNGAYSVRLGNNNVGSEAERLVRSFTVSEANRLFIYRYALVLEEPEGHPQEDMPQFEVRVFDENDSIIDPAECGYYQVTAGPETNTTDWGQHGSVRYKDWSTVGIDLSAYIGTEVTIEFTVKDCGWGGHFGYAYLDAACGYLGIQVLGFCEGSTNVTLVAPDGFDSYYWPHSGQTTQSVVIPVPEVGDSIAVEVTNQSGCSTTLLHIFEEYPLVDAGTGNDTLVCAGQPVDLWCIDVGPNANYSWTANGVPISEEQLLTVRPLETTVYEVIVSNPNGCFSPDSAAALTVTVDNDLVFSLPDDTLICLADSLTLTAPLAGYDYLWYAGTDTLGTGASVTVSPVDEQLVYLRISNENCTFTDSIVVSVYNAGTFPDSISVDFCPGQTVLNISGPVNFSTYSWSNGLTTENISIDPYTDTLLQLLVVSPGGCTDSITYLMQESAFPVPAIFTFEDTICSAHTAMLSAMSQLPCNYSWTTSDGVFAGGGAVLAVSPLHTTTYIVQATTSAGCSDAHSFDTVTVVVDESAYFELPESLELCQGVSDTLLAPPAVLNFEWSDGGSVISTDPQLVVSPSFTQNYYLVVHSATCTYSDYTTVTVFPVGDQTLDVVSCSASPDVTLTAPEQYTAVYWPSFGNSASVNVQNNPTDGMEVLLYATNAYSCTDTVRYRIDRVQPSVVYPLENDTICYGSPVSLHAESDSTYDEFVWVTGLNTVGFGADLFDMPQATTVYTVYVSNPYNCVTEPSSQSVTVTVIGDQVLVPMDPVVVCPGTAVSLASPGTNGSFSWSYNTQASADPVFVFTPDQSGFVTVTVTQGSCTDQQTVPVTVVQPYTYNITADPFAPCTGDDVTLGLQPPVFGQVSWLTGGTVVSSSGSTVVSPASSATYVAEIVDPNGCSTTAEQLIDVTEMPHVNLGPDISVCNAPSAQLASPGTPGSYSFQWSTSETTETIGVTASGTYTLTVTNGNCAQTDAVSVQFINGSYIGQVPNVITPNGDGLNDRFEIVSQNLEDYTIAIVNRWGNRIFMSDDPAAAWDGTAGGDAVDEGVYFYEITYRIACESEPRTLQGHVTVSRD